MPSRGPEPYGVRWLVTVRDALIVLCLLAVALVAFLLVTGYGEGAMWAPVGDPVSLADVLREPPPFQTDLEALAWTAANGRPDLWRRLLRAEREQARRVVAGWSQTLNRACDYRATWDSPRERWCACADIVGSWVGVCLR